MIAGNMQYFSYDETDEKSIFRAIEVTSETLFLVPGKYKLRTVKPFYVTHIEDSKNSRMIICITEEPVTVRKKQEILLLNPD